MSIDASQFARILGLSLRYAYELRGLFRVLRSKVGVGLFSGETQLHKYSSIHWCPHTV